METEVRPRRFARWVGVLLAPGVWLERTRGRKRLGLLVLYALVVAFVGFWFWWATSLWKLPDVGEPFDRTVYEAERVPEAENAFILYQQASGRLKPTTATQNAPVWWGLIRGGWSKADPEIHQWVEDNREAMALWRRGTERPRYQPTDDDERIRFDGHRRVSTDLYAFNLLALLEGSRLEGQGDMAEAWGWYNAALRASRHVTMRSGFDGRSIGRVMSQTIQERIIPWSKDPRVDASLLRRALADVRSAITMTPPASETIKAEYANMIWAIEHPDRWTHRLEGSHVWFNQQPWVLRTALFLKREPARSRRIYQIIFGHWLAHCDDPPERRPPMAAEITIEAWGTTNRYPNFPYIVPASGLDAIHPLLAEDLARWLSSTIYASTLMSPMTYVLESADRDRTGQGVLLVTIAEQLYQRERGEEPPSPETLVGPYLDRLPEGYTIDSESNDSGPLPVKRPLDGPAPGRRVGGR
jgi:hypothetical protein